MSWMEAARLLGLSQIMKIGLLKAVGFEEAVLRLPDGMRIIMDLNQVPGALYNILHIYYHEDYSFTSEAIPRPGWKIVDAGAYLGAYTMWSARRVEPGGEVVALEPHPRSRELLQRTIMFNGLRNVRVLPYALSIHEGRGKLYSPRYRALASLRREHAEYFCGEVVEEHEVECVSLRTLLSMLGSREIDLLKLDIEGLEYDVLRSSTDVLGRIKRIAVEVHLDSCSIPELDQLLRDNGFEAIIKFDARAENQAFIIALRKSWDEMPALSKYESS
ncbi:MAG: FkbM family methyltransferase [Nitrososphaerota archaeon]